MNGLLALITENKGKSSAIVVAALVIMALGGNVAISLPADAKAEAAMGKAIEVEEMLAQNFIEQKAEYATRGIERRDDELQRLDHEMRYLSDQINRLNTLPTYLGRDLTAEEKWQLEQLKGEWVILRDRQNDLIN